MLGFYSNGAPMDYDSYDRIRNIPDRDEWDNMYNTDYYNDDELEILTNDNIRLDSCFIVPPIRDN